MKRDYPWIEIQHCLDHALDLINEWAYKKIPLAIRDLIQSIPAKIRSPDSRSVFKQMWEDISL